MKTEKWKQYTFWILLSLGTGLFSGWLIRDAVVIYGEQIQKPPLSPPASLFPIVWTVLYILMGISAAMISLSPESRERSRSLNLFVIQLILNFFWSPVFFNAQAFGIALLILILLWFSVLWMILSFAEVNKLAAFLQLPYLLWLTFAAYMNYGVWYLN